MTLLLDYYGEMLTERQRSCLDLRYNQDMTLGEIAEELGVSRQGVHENLSRAEELLLRMEEKLGCIRREKQIRTAAQQVLAAADQLAAYPDKTVSELAAVIRTAAAGLEE